METITIKEVKQLIKDGKTEDGKYKLEYRSQVSDVKIGSKDFSFFDILFKGKKRDRFHCCIHLYDLEKQDQEVLNVLIWN